MSRNLDMQIAIEIMGYSEFKVRKSYADEIHIIAPGQALTPHTVCEYVTGSLVASCLPEQRIPHYSSDMNAAMQVVEKLNSFHFFFERMGNHCAASFGFEDGGPQTGLYNVGPAARVNLLRVTAPTAAEAICLAALKYVSKERYYGIKIFI